MKNLSEKINKELLDLLPKEKSTYPCRVSNIVLFKDFRRRIIEWYVELGKINDWKSDLRTKRLTILEELNPSIQKEMPSSEDFRTEFLSKSTIGAEHFYEYDHFFVYKKVLWDIFDGDSYLKKYTKMSSPYEGVVKIIERGDTIIRSESHYKVGMHRVFEHPKYNGYTIPSLDNKFLDFIDQRCGANSNNTPNQRGLDLLWDDFNTGENKFIPRHEIRK